jgi:hypothetical protein
MATRARPSQLRVPAPMQRWQAEQARRGSSAEWAAYDCGAGAAESRP